MSKEVPLTDALKAKIAASYGDDTVDFSNLAVFEAVALNTKPLLRRTGLHAGARIGPDVLAAMAAKASGPRTVPLKQMHRGGALPTGKVFSAQTYATPDGHLELRSMFYMPRQESSDLIAKLNANIIGEVSVGIQTKNLLCSACNFDYGSEDATCDNIWDCICPDGHKIGKDGIHLKLHGLEDWAELSLVDRGAADGAMVLPRPKQLMGRDPARIALRGFDLGLLSLYASVEDTKPLPSPTPQKEVNLMDYTEKFVALSSEHAVVQHKLSALEAASAAAVTATAAEITSLKAANADLTAKLTVATATDGVKAAAELADANKFMDELVTASLAATGKSGTALPETISAKVVLLREARAGLALVIPPGGTSAKAAKGDEAPVTNHAAFKRA